MDCINLQHDCSSSIFAVTSEQCASKLETADSAVALSLQTSRPAAWKGFLASFYGGIAEEILLRLFVMSFFVWLGHFISKAVEGKPQQRYSGSQTFSRQFYLDWGIFPRWQCLFHLRHL
ncbi:MAG TPA: hypothetical protein VF896_10280 [Anaerolineales bacterium]